MAEVMKVRVDDRRGTTVRIPSDLASRLPDNAGITWELDEDQPALIGRIVEIQEKPAKLKAAKA
jgi:hypothetical protein